MFVNYWSGEDWAFDKEKEQDKDAKLSVIMKELLKTLGDDAVTLNTIEIETINRCNNDCSFCPVSKGNDKRTLQKMSVELFKKIIDELSIMEYAGVISLFSNNEPLIDDRLISFLSYAAEKLPRAKHVLFTNGLLLTCENYKVLVDYLDCLVIDNYNDDLRLNGNIQDIIDADIDEQGCLVKVDVRKKNQVLLNRGGISPNNENIAEFHSPCILPFIQMVIRPDGKVSRCCQDAYGEETMGDLSKQSIWEIWYGQQYETYRFVMLHDRRHKLPACKKCDIKGMYTNYPHRWIDVFDSICNKYIVYGDEFKTIKFLTLSKSERKDLIEKIRKASSASKLFVYGTGYNMHKLINGLGIIPTELFDTNHFDEMILGKKVHKPQEIAEYDDSYLILVTPSSYNDILNKLIQMQISEERIVIGETLF